MKSSHPWILEEIKTKKEKEKKEISRVVWEMSERYISNVYKIYAIEGYESDTNKRNKFS